MRDIIFPPRQVRAATMVVSLLALSHLAVFAQDSRPEPQVALRSSEALAAPPPSELLTHSPQWKASGRGVLRFFGFKAYDATLWIAGAETAWSFEKPFALEIRYATAIKGKDISNTSLIELQRISPLSPEQIESWATLMDTIFVDVKPNDRLTGVHLPGVGVRFFLNGKLAGETADTAFSEAFFRIWLDPKTKRQDLRTALLGLP